MEERRTIVILSPAHQGGAFLFAQQANLPPICAASQPAAAACDDRRVGVARDFCARYAEGGHHKMRILVIAIT